MMNELKSPSLGVTGAPLRTQGKALHDLHISDIVARMRNFLSCALVGTIALLAAGIGLSNPVFGQSSTDPVAVLHSAEGGAIAQPRPAMPNADAAYPNLSTVPAHPPVPDRNARNAVAQKLVADRANAQYETKSEPLPVPQPPAPVKSAQGGDDSMGATMSAVQAKPAPRPVKAADATPVAKSSPAAAPAPIKTDKPAASAVAVATPAAPVASLPPMASAPPRAPAFAGVPPQVQPTPPPVAPPAAAPVRPATVLADAAKAPQIRVGFAPGSDMLTGEALATLKVFAHSRGSRSIVVTGFGDVDSADARTQTAGLQLALNRARAVAAYLTNVGVPPTSLRVSAEAQGSGAIALLAN